MKNKLFYLTVLTGLIACGQTGPLYLPDSPPPIHVEPERETPIYEGVQADQDQDQDL